MALSLFPAEVMKIHSSQWLLLPTTPSLLTQKKLWPFKETDFCKISANILRFLVCYGMFARLFEAVDPSLQLISNLPFWPFSSINLKYAERRFKKLR